MAQLIIEVTDLRKRTFDALCAKNGWTIEQMFEAHLSSVEQNEGRVFPEDSIEDQIAAVEKLEAKAEKIGVARGTVETILQNEVQA